MGVGSGVGVGVGAGVGVSVGSAGYDLNTGCGSGSAYIYMHTVKSQGWTISKNAGGTQCNITGFDGPKAGIRSITVPLTLDGAQVVNFTGNVFSGFTNLESMTFDDNTAVSQMPSVQGCSKFKQVRTGTALDVTPPSMTAIPASAFAGTAIEYITLTSVASVGNYAFSGCSSLRTVNANASLHSIGTQAFSNCGSMSHLWFDGTDAQWNAVSKGSQWRSGSNFQAHWHCMVTFDANGRGTAPAAQAIQWSNYDKATEPAAPTATCAAFRGWYTEAACTNQWNFNSVVPGDITLYAKWDVQYSFDSTTGELALLWGDFNKNNKWGSDVAASAVKCVTATSQVRFTGDCGDLFSGFGNCTSMDLDRVNTANVTNMWQMFSNCSRLTTLDLSEWDTGSVSVMAGMFQNCGNLTTIYVTTDWNTENVVNSGIMFLGCNKLVGGCGTTFNRNFIDKTYARIDRPDQPGYLTGLFTLSVPGEVTASATPFCSLDSVDYYTAGTTVTLTYNGEVPAGKMVIFAVNGSTIKDNTFEMPFDDVVVTVTVSNPPRYIFDSTTGKLALLWGEFSRDDKWGDDVSSMDVTSVTATDQVRFMGNCTEMFSNFINCTSMELNCVDTQYVNDMSYMFNHCTSLTSLDISSWNTSYVNDMFSMFKECQSLTSLDISGWNTSEVENMRYMFCDCVKLTSLDISGWNTGKVIDMQYMFCDCVNLTSLDISGWNTGNVTDMQYMFYNCSRLTSLDLSGWNTGNVTNMQYMFYNCINLTSLDLSGWNTSKVTNMSHMFSEFLHLSSLDLSGWNTGNVTNMGAMFAYSQFTWLNLSGWNTANVTDMSRMFYRSGNLTTIYVTTGWDTGNVSNSEDMFNECSKLEGGMGTTYDTGHLDNGYARIDRPGLPGYLTGVFALTLPGEVTTSSAPFCTIDSVGYYNAGDAVTLSYNGDVPEGKEVIFAVNGTAIEGDTFEMPLDDVVVTVTIGGDAGKPGDLNGDGNVDVLDVNIVINLVLGRVAAAEVTGDPDLDGSGAIDVVDVNALINLILQ